MSEQPSRVQRKRARGWKMPPNTVYVGRPSKWGNPFIVRKSGGVYTAKVMNVRHAWQLYKSVASENEALVTDARSELRGKNLACWCALPSNPYEPDTCHAAVLLEIANMKELSGRDGGSFLRRPCGGVRLLSLSKDSAARRPHASPLVLCLAMKRATK